MSGISRVFGAALVVFLFIVTFVFIVNILAGLLILAVAILAFVFMYFEA